MHYILLGRLTDAGQKRVVEDPDTFNRVFGEMDVPGTQVLSRYVVMGQYDFVVIAESETPEAMVRLSLELGARVGLHIETLPAIGAGHLADPSHGAGRVEASAAESPEPREGSPS